jgi:predicted nucleic acid-binding protein
MEIVGRPFRPSVPDLGFAVSACRDPDDNKFLEATVAARAEYVVTSDKDLRDLGEYEGVKIEDALVMRRSTVRIRSPAPYFSTFLNIRSP